MNKQEFLAALKSGLSGMPQDDIDGRLAFYGEIIDDRVEEGLSESAAVDEIGPVSDVVSQIVSDIPLSKLVKERVKPNRALRAWEIALIILGFPLWLPLLIAAGAVILSLYITVWSLIISLWAVESAFSVSALGGIAVSACYFASGRISYGVAVLGAGLVLAGISVLLFFGCTAASKGIAVLTKKAAIGIKSMFVGKGKAK